MRRILSRVGMGTSKPSFASICLALTPSHHPSSHAQAYAARVSREADIALLTWEEPGGWAVIRVTVDGAASLGALAAAVTAARSAAAAPLSLIAAGTARGPPPPPAASLAFAEDLVASLSTVSG